MRLMGIEAIYPKPNLSKPHPDHKIYPYLLRNKIIKEVNQVWGIDITYIRMKHGWLYLVVIMDWVSRYILSWELSIILEVDFCIRALDKALTIAVPEIFNSDQDCQFTSVAFLKCLEERNIQISMDAKGRAMDNVFSERLPGISELYSSYRFLFSLLCFHCHPCPILAVPLHLPFRRECLTLS